MNQPEDRTAEAPQNQEVQDAQDLSEDYGEAETCTETNSPALPPVQEPSQDENQGFLAELYEWGVMLSKTVILLVMMFIFVAGVYSVNQESMTHTLEEGEMLLTSNLFYTPKVKDIVLFTKSDVDLTYDPVHDRYSPMVKRVVAVAGDSLYFDEDSRKMVLNGIPQDEPYLRDQKVNPKGGLLNGGAENPLIVPEGYIFVCGDNRNGSHDSRDFGLVDERMVLGRVLLRLFPLNRFGTV